MATFWITGASGAIGSALARRLARQGHALALSGRRQDALDVLASELDVPHVLLTGDLSQPGIADAQLSQAITALGPLDGFAHAVGSTLIRPLHLTRDDDLASLMAVNYFSAAYALRGFVQQARSQRRPGAAVLIGSLVAEAGFPNHEGIAAAKAAVAALALSTAASYADKGIRVNCVHPGLTVSPLTARLTGTPETAARQARINPMQRLGQPDDIAALMAFLLSADAGWITGQQIGVDGGHARIHPLPRD